MVGHQVGLKGKSMKDPDWSQRTRLGTRQAPGRISVQVLSVDCHQQLRVPAVAALLHP